MGKDDLLDLLVTTADDEIVMTTSWWTTRATLGSTLPREQVLYLLQEDERMFYPAGDEQLRFWIDVALGRDARDP